jgi:hypothetical protein
MDDALLKELRRQEEVLTEGENGGQDGDEVPQEEATAPSVEAMEDEPEPPAEASEAVAPSGNILDWTEGDA